MQTDVTTFMNLTFVLAVQQLVNQLVAELDAAEEGVVTVATSARAARLDAALLRAGRLEAVSVGLPDISDRREMVAAWAAGVGGRGYVEGATAGWTGAEIQALCQRLRRTAAGGGGGGAAEMPVIVQMVAASRPARLFNH